MISQNSNQIPTPQDENNDSPRGISVIIGSLIVDGIAQMFMTWWFTWILLAGLNFTSYNPWAWWAGTTMSYVTLHSYNYKIAGNVLIVHLKLFLIFTALIFIFK